MGERPDTVPELVLIEEARIRELLPGAPGDVEASGVVPLDDTYLVIFDSSTAIGIINQVFGNRIGNRMEPADGGPATGTGYEDIAVDDLTGELFLLVEEERRGAGFMSRVDVRNRTFEEAPGFWLDLPLMGGNKGMEGLTLVRRNGQPFLLALCEGNRCQSGDPGKIPGGGRVHVFRPGPNIAAHVAEIRLPEWLWFEDYSSVAVRNNRIAVVSQRSSALWVGRLEPTAWRVAGPGTCYEFPHNATGQITYCTVEGLAWLGNDRIVVVSDAAGDRNRPCQAKQQSVHVFRFPAPG